MSKSILLLLLGLWGGGVLYAQRHDMHNMAPGTPAPAVRPETGQYATDGNTPGADARPHTVVYHLTVSDTLVRYTGRRRRALAINGSIPAPTLYFTEGDTAEIYVRNTLKEETIIHWHGVILPNQEDGVPYASSCPTRRTGSPTSPPHP